MWDREPFLRRWKMGFSITCQLWSLLVPPWGMGEGNGTPLQYSCQENPMDGEAWWAAVQGVARSRT